MTVEFSREAETPPDWLDYSAFAPAVPMFYKNSQVILAAFVVGVLIEGFTTNIAQSFFRPCAETLILIGFPVGAGSDSRENWPLVPFPRSVDLAPARNPEPGSGVTC